MVADNDSGESVESEVRTSSGMFLSKKQVSFTSEHVLSIVKLSNDLLHLNHFVCSVLSIYNESSENDHSNAKA